MDRRIAFGIIAIFTVALMLGAAIIGALVLMDLERGNDGPVKDKIDLWTGEGLDEMNATSEGISDIANAMNQFGIDLYLELLNGSENVFISPYSIFTALSMTYEGARGNTASEMADVLHLPDNDTVRRGSFARVQNKITNGSDDYELVSPNKIWPQEGYPFLQSFNDIIEDFYYGGIEELDYSDPEAARQIINEWVEEQTNERIKDLLPKDSLTPPIAMILTNAIYFYGNWLYEFNKADTKDESFHLSSGTTVKVPMMSMKVEEGLRYYKDDLLEAIELPYKGGDLSMLVLLPKDDMATMGGSLSEDGISNIIDGLHSTEVDVHLPRFELETDYGLEDALMSLGMIDAFDLGGADFGNMAPDPYSGGLYVSAVRHRAFVKVDEEGTEAAAATAVVISLEGGDVTPVFRADHPFMFFIIHKETDSVLFLGKVEDPRGLP